ncbi:MAG: anthranilate synthase component I [Verrucomicrobiaceae bacterium]|nr:anthranilate synthase component I [Verrucomicrobiaceae bacterium]
MTAKHCQPDFETFRALSAEGNLLPVSIELAADYETTLSAFEKISDGRCAFLLESAEMSSVSGRFSILGSSPRIVFTARGKECEIEERGKLRKVTAERDPLEELERVMKQCRLPKGVKPGVFHGGAVGYLAYDVVRYFEPSLPPPPPDTLGIPDMVFFVTDTVLVFDHKHRKVSVTANVFIDEHPSLDEAYKWALEQLNGIVGKLAAPLPLRAPRVFPALTQQKVPEFRSNTTQAEYEGMVTKAREYIAAGDIFQVVPSQRMTTDYKGSPIDLFRALRHVNPSPYMFCLTFPQGFSLVGSSPEVHVKCMNRRIDIRPIAGTRWRGKTTEEDDALAADLLADPKENAEHIMLVDLARNDVGRVARYGTVNVSDLRVIERYSHVMHIVSNVDGELDPSHSAYDVMRATFPAGTVSGSPKVRAMEIISELEKAKRCAYAGAVGYFGFDGNLDSCIALRTCVLKDGEAHVQAGAGVVADSDPTYEYNETVNKATGMLKAIAWARELGAE